MIMLVEFHNADLHKFQDLVERVGAMVVMMAPCHVGHHELPEMLRHTANAVESTIVKDHELVFKKRSET